MKPKASLFGTMLLASLVFGTPFPALADAASPHIIFSEVNWAGSSLSTADEWIEIVNTSESDVDISGYSLAGAAGTSGAAITIPSGTTLTAHGTFIISNYDVTSDKTTLTTAPNLVTTAVSLPNSKLAVSLLDASGSIVDTATTASTPKTGSTAPFATMERNLTDLSWSTSASMANLKDTSQFGTPGWTNLPAIVAEEPVPVSVTEESIAIPEEIQTVDVVETPVSPPVLPASGEVAAPVNDTNDLVAPATEVLVSDPVVSETAPVTTEPVIENNIVIPEIVSMPTEVIAPIEEIVPATGMIVTDAVAENSTISDVSPVVAAIEEQVAPTEIEAGTIVIGTADATNPITEEMLATESAESSVTPETPVTLPTLSVGTPTSAESSVGAETPTSYSPGDLLITEFVSDPADGTEWIELYNATNDAIDLTGWTVADATGKTTALSGSLEASMYGTVENPKGKLNNDGDDIIVTAPSGNVIDQLTYGTDEIPKPKKGTSVALAGDLWIVTTEPTPGNANFIPEETTYETNDNGQGDPAPTATDAVATATDSNESQTVSDAHQVRGGSVARLSTASDVSTASASAGSLKMTPMPRAKTATKAKTVASTAKKSTKTSASVATVSYTGVVTALPGTFGSQIAFMNGIEIYFNNADWPALQLGDVIQVRGVPSTAQGESRIKIASAIAISVTGHQEESAQETAISDIALAKEGALVRIEGTIATRNGKTLTLEDESGQIDVIAHEKTGLSWSSYTGGTLQITGVVRHLNGETFIYPRSSDDIVVVTDTLSAANIASTAALTGDATGSSGTMSAILPFLGAVLATSGVSALVLWFLKRRRTISTSLHLAETSS